MRIAIVLLWSAAAWAGPLAEEGIAAYEHVDYGEAARLLKQALSQERFEGPELERVYLYYGSALLGVRDEVGAERAFATLLAIRPDFPLGSELSPKVREAMRRARDTVSRRARIEHHPPPSLQRPLELDALVEAPGSFRAVVEYTREGTVHKDPLDCVGERCHISLPGGGAKLVYRLALLTPEGALALPTQVFELRAQPAAHTPIYKRWWLWTVVGVVVAGAVATGVGVGVAQHESATSVRVAARRDCGGSASCPLWSTP